MGRPCQSTLMKAETNGSISRLKLARYISFRRVTSYITERIKYMPAAVWGLWLYASGFLGALVLCQRLFWGPYLYDSEFWGYSYMVAAFCGLLFF